MSKLKIVVLYDRALVDDSEDAPSAGDRVPVTRTLDKKEVEEEVAEALIKLGHEPVMHELDGTPKSLLGLARTDCDLVFNLIERKLLVAGADDNRALFDDVFDFESGFDRAFDEGLDRDPPQLCSSKN